MLVIDNEKRVQRGAFGGYSVAHLPFFMPTGSNENTNWGDLLTRSYSEPLPPLSDFDQKELRRIIAAIARTTRYSEM